MATARVGTWVAGSRTLVESNREGHHISISVSIRVSSLFYAWLAQTGFENVIRTVSVFLVIARIRLTFLQSLFGPPPTNYIQFQFVQSASRRVGVSSCGQIQNDESLSEMGRNP